MRALYAVVVGILFACFVVFFPANAQAIRGSGGGGLTAAVANGLYCQLAGCTMTGNTNYSGAAGLMAADNVLDLYDTGGVARGSITPNSASTIGTRFQATVGAALGSSVNRTATQIAAAFTDNNGSQNILVARGAGLLSLDADSIQAVTCTGAGTALDIQSSRIEITNNATTNCVVTVAETSAQAGGWTNITIVGGTGTTVDFADQANILNVGGTYTMGPEDSLNLTYMSTGIWVETARSNN